VAWRIRPGGIEVRVRVTPRGGRDAIDGVEALSDGRPVLKVRVRAVPEDGAANEGVSLEAGATARLKTFVISGEGEALAAAFAALTGRTDP
jgi:uncharacterized protein